MSRSTHLSTHLRAIEDGDRFGNVLIIAALLIVAYIIGYDVLRAHNAHATGWPTSRAQQGTEHPGHLRSVPCSSLRLTPYQAINCVFPLHLRRKAKLVAECESTASASESVARRNGLGRWASDYATHTHWGIFELGPAERRRHGRYQIGDPALRQVRSAYDLYQHRGWEPWRASLNRCHIR